MNNKLIIALLFCLLASECMFAQSLASDKTTRALIIGISDYADDQIPDLRFAHKDAEAFAAFLLSKAGGSLAEENITLLTNSKATIGSVVGGMDWLISDSKQGDKTIIYFSGHGDVETRTRFNRGFLLCHDTPPSNYMAGAFALIFLQDIISTLADQGVEVVMISDACRAGKLAGSDIGGPHATTANLAKQFANEVKILSCQANEFSLEGEQWGNGRGVFSYHLIDGLSGMADGNNDYEVNLLEINRYLEEKVPEETAPQVQIPLVVGNRGKVLTIVDDESLAIALEQKKNKIPTISSIDTRGMEDLFLLNLDSIWQKKYKQFTAALDRMDLLEPPGNNACDLYQELAEVEELQALHNVMLRNLATALQDESQRAVNAYLNVNNKELSDMSMGDLKYAKFSRYLEKCAELLGPKHYIYKSIKAKQYYFEAMKVRVEISDRTTSLADSILIWREWRKEKLEKALEYEPNAAFIYNELGVDFGMEGLEQFQKAITLSPTWAIPYINISKILKKNQREEEAFEYALKAVDLAPKSGMVYNMMGRNYVQLKQYDKAEPMFLKSVECAPGHVGYLHRLGKFYFDTKRFKEAEKVLYRVLEMNERQMHTYNRLSELYIQKNLEYDKGEAICRKKLKVRPTDGEAYCYLVDVYGNSRQMNKLRSLVTEMEQMNDSVENWEGTMCLGYAHQLLNDYEQAITIIHEAINSSPNSRWVYYRLARLQHELQDYDSFFQNVYTSLDRGMYYNWIGRRFYWRAATHFPGYLDFANQVVEDVPKQGFYHRLMGLYYDSQGEFDKAHVHFQKAVELSPERIINWLHRAESRYLAGQKEEAKPLFKEFIEWSPGNAFNDLQVAHFLRIHSEYDLAESYIQDALKKSPSRQEAYWNLAWIHFSKGDLKAAQQTLDKGISMQSEGTDLSMLFYLKGLLFYHSGQLSESLSWLRKAARLNTRLTSLTQAVEKEMAGDMTVAISLFEQAMKDNPADDNILHLNARLKIQQEDYNTGLKLLQKAFNLCSISSTAEILHFRGGTYDFLINDPKLTPVQQTPEFRKLMDRYFPEKRN